jgi:hypothetical protein
MSQQVFVFSQHLPDSFMKSIIDIIFAKVLSLYVVCPRYIFETFILIFDGLIYCICLVISFAITFTFDF